MSDHRFGLSATAEARVTKAAEIPAATDEQDDDLQAGDHDGR